LQQVTDVLLLAVAPLPQRPSVTADTERWLIVGLGSWPVGSRPGHRGYVEAAQDGVMDADEALLASLHEEAVLLQRLVDGLQTLALAEARRLPLHLEAVDVKDIVGQATTAFRVSADSAEVELVTESQISTRDGVELPTVVGHGPTAAAPGAPEPRGQRAALLTQGGPGDAAARPGGRHRGPRRRRQRRGDRSRAPPHVFDRFWRADQSRPRDTGGSGLGLAICYELVDALGGSVTVESTVGVGATFTVRLPAWD
jgi:two-component system sensor histidine kinase BaeS